MPLEYWEFDDAMDDLRRNVAHDIDKSESRLGREMAEGFNRVAKALEALTEEVRALRNELNPCLDKPKKLPAPGGGA